ncbi:glucosaminidase domain-containing protein [Candidatus Daviesbacteria bacterium]|nr:glucosaminidase domain-containing protein [Candidatus Daviesbacteria bacterium]
MNKYFFIFLILIIFTSPFSGVSAKDQFQPEQEMKIQIKKLDKRAYILKKYLAQFNSPLEDHAQDFVEAADLYQIDWKLVPAIAGVESTFGKFIPGGYNGWGWGVYGDQALQFKSWRDGIFTVSKGLKENYIDKGLTDPYAINRKYAASPHWGWKVSYFINDIEEFTRKNTLEADLLLSPVFEEKKAISSAKLALEY